MAHILLVDARFYPEIADTLVQSAAKEIEGNGSTHEQVSVPGALEIPAAIRYGIESGKFDGYVALGCVIEGETDHYEHVCRESIRGINDLAMGHMAAIGNGILTVKSKEQAMKRAGDGNKGGFAALACLAMINIKSKFGLSGR